MDCVIKVTISFILFSTFLYVNCENNLESKDFNLTRSLLSLWNDEGKCNAGKNCATSFDCTDAGSGIEQVCIRSCVTDSDCEINKKCMTGWIKVCYRPCTVDSDCESHMTCKDESICFWNSCDKNADCENDLVCASNFCLRKCDCGKDGACRFDQGRKVCQCDEGFKEKDGKCTETCKADSDCANGGVCEKKDENKFCSCKAGLVGDKCETVFACTPDGKYKDCEKSGGKCSYNGIEATCECFGEKILNQQRHICTDCICKGGTCVMEGGKEVCKCPPGFGNFTKTSCKACDCGKDTDCIWEERFGGEKICLCKPGHSTKKGKCVACGCGNGSSCEWISEGWLKPERKVCHCKPGFHEEDGKCVDATATSSRATTESPITTSSLFSTIRECHCGPFSYSCTFDSAGNKICRCFMGYSQLDGTCAECNCGPHGACSFQNGHKKCDCKSFASEVNGVCFDTKDLQTLCER